MKIGVYGGTFNPPHLGHVTAARAVFELLKLDLLLLVPDREPPHKALPAGSVFFASPSKKGQKNRACVNHSPALSLRRLK